MIEADVAEINSGYHSGPSTMGTKPVSRFPKKPPEYCWSHTPTSSEPQHLPSHRVWVRQTGQDMSGKTGDQRERTADGLGEWDAGETPEEEAKTDISTVALRQRLSSNFILFLCKIRGHDQ